MPRSPRPASCICVTLPSHSGRVRLTSLLALSSLLLALCTLPFISHAASFGINSLSPWERAGLRVRSIAEETKEKNSLSPRAVSPHPNPLPEGEGIVTVNRSRLTAHSLSWLSEHAWMIPPANADGTDFFTKIFASRSARTLNATTPVAGRITLTATAGTLGPTDYATLRAAFDAINAGMHQGVISISVVGDTTETASALLQASGSGPASYSSISI